MHGRTVDILLQANYENMQKWVLSTQKLVGLLLVFVLNNDFGSTSLLPPPCPSLVCCKGKRIPYAERVFDRMLDKDVISWTAMIVGYGQNGHSENAVEAFSDMLRDGTDPDEFTLGSVISSCANLASLEEGTQCHCRAVLYGFTSFLTVSNALITLYGKCGSLDDSYRVFCEMSVEDEVSWTAMVSGYAQFGRATETIETFEDIIAQGLKPDAVTFIRVLSACSRAGLVERGRKYFDSMVNEHRITPIVDHYTCMIDLFSRSGKLQEAKAFIENIPFSPDAFGWATLLSSCRFHGVDTPK